MGRADFIVAVPENERFTFYVLEAKFTKEEKLFHRFQAIIYAYLLNQVLDGLKIDGEIKLAVVTKGAPLTEWPPTGTLSFPQEVEEYILTLENKLGEDGPFYAMLNSEKADLWLTMRCAECPFEPVCIAKAVERRDLGLLGIQPGYQKVFREAGVKTINDLADLYEFPVDKKGRSWPTNFKRPITKKPEVVAHIVGKTELSNLPKLSKMAQVIKKEIERKTNDVRPEFIPGTGYSLPVENGYFYPENSLVRVYLFVQHNPIHDTLIGISGVVENSDSKRIRVLAEVADEIPEGEEEALKMERNLLVKFFTEVLYAIIDVAPNLEGQYYRDPYARNKKGEPAFMVGSRDDVFLHLYFYSRFHRDKLMEAVKRHREVYGMNAIRSFLSLRKAIDQEGYSIIKDELIKRHALRFPPGLGIIPVVHQFQLNWGEAPEEYQGNAPSCSHGGWFRWNGLEEKFEDLFRFLVEKDENGRLILFKEDNSCPLYNIGKHSFGGYGRIPPLYPIFHREDEQVPLYVIWNAFTKNKQEELKHLLKYLALAVRHIERSIPESTKDRFVKKTPFSLQDLVDFNIENVSLAEVLEEYQKLEYSKRKEELQTHHRLPLSVRVLSGRSIVIKISKVEKDKGRKIKIIGHVVLPPTDDEGIWRDYASSEAPLFSLDESSWVVITPIKNECKKEGGMCLRLVITDKKDPAFEISRSPLAVINRFDRKTGEVELSFLPLRQHGPFLLSHSFPKNDYSGIQINGETISGGSYLAIDPAMDDLNMNRAYTVLEEILKGSRHHYLYKKLQDIYSSERFTHGDIKKYRIHLWEREHIEEFVNLLENVGKVSDGVHAPNSSQKGFILDIDHFLVSLQGPPGTGKTSGAVAPAILARAYSSIKQKKNSVFIVTGVSHRAIDEALIRTAKLRLALRSHAKELGNIELIRVASSGDALPQIENNLRAENFMPEEYNVALTYAEGNKIRELLSSTRLDGWLSQTGRVKVIFATPGTIFKLFKDLTKFPPMAELVVIDEASMMDLPMFIMATMGAKDSSQVLIVGDHRQMQPIQTHNWEVEDRKTIEEHVPFLSAINFLRFLRGELDPEEHKEFEKLLYRNPPLWESKEVMENLLPIHRLRETHRLPQIAAEMHSELIYSKDGIELVSKKRGDKKRQLMQVVTNLKVPEWVRWILHPEYPYVIIEHNDTSSTKVNELEAKIVSEIVKAIPRGLDVGVVVPYRAHKALIYRKFRDLGREVLVDTIERFQGGEKDVIIISMASSDPTYLATVFDFIYDQNRFNVAASRMREKLILIASKSLFTASAFDLEQFEKVKVWKRFYLRVKKSGETSPMLDFRAIEDIPIRVSLYRLREWK
ncbi:DNA helicase [Thermococcus indicus]|uniref:DNA helicase n=1 Tax=Thermococcus indicus TaxID=2586643 RepID=A0A4Y5SMM5_9EURY|nr:bifunctional RecB family nuclease/DEAD/DEAH box helicase [Thermococcus indicus]QDA31331.1 DNA helicase [Thermococcus indicus]